MSECPKCHRLGCLACGEAFVAAEYVPPTTVVWPVRRAGSRRGGSSPATRGRRERSTAIGARVAQEEAEERQLRGVRVARGFAAVGLRVVHVVHADHGSGEARGRSGGVGAT